MKNDGRAESVGIVGAIELEKIEKRLVEMENTTMTQQEVVQAFQDSMNTMLKAFEETTGYRAQQTVALSPALKAVLQAAGAPTDGWQADLGWTFTPVSVSTSDNG